MIYKHHCTNCHIEWESHFKVMNCPKCGFSSNALTSCLEPGEERPKLSEGGEAFGMFIAYLFVGLMALPYVLLPGALLTMLFNLMFGITPGWVSFFMCLGISLVVFAFTGFNIKNYLVLDLVLIILFFILAMCIDDFYPFVFARSYSFPWIWGDEYYNATHPFGH